MTRQNVTEGPREILTSKCPTCHGDGIVLSVQSAAMDAERRLRALAAGSKRGVEAFQVELEEHVAEHLIGPGAERLVELEELAKRRFFIERKAGVGLDHFKVLGEGKLAELAPQGPLSEGQELRVELVEVGLHDVDAATAKHDGVTVSVANAAKLVGKKLKVRIDRVLDGTAYASLVQSPAGTVYTPITAEAEAEKPTRAPRRKAAAEQAPAIEKPKRRPKAAAAEAVAEEPVEEQPVEEQPEEPAAEQKPKRKTRRGSRGGRGRRKKTAVAAAASNGEAEAAPVATIHVPAPELGVEDGASTDGEAAPADGAQPVKKKRTRRGSRGGRNRRKKPAVAKTEPDS
jgi:predicted RNA-binding protein with TRAM domain